MARTLKAGLTAVLDGGSMYTLVRFTKNTSDDWGSGISYIVAGTIRTDGFGADTTVWSDALMDISEIDNAASPLDDPTALTSDVRVVFDNTSGSISGADYVGRVVEVAIGYGSTMSDATYDVFFTGKVQEAIPDRQNLVFVCRGKGELRNKEIGEPLPDTVNEKYRGKIYPIAYGDWTDDNAYLPVVVTSSFGDAPEIIFDTQPWKSFDSIQLYDEQTETNFNTSDETQFTVGDDNNKLNFFTDTGTTLTNTISEFDNELVVDDYTKIIFDVGDGSTAASQCIILIDEEMMLVTRDPAEFSGNKVHVERVYGGTTMDVHLAGAVIYQVTDSYGSLRIQLSHTFWPQGFSGMNHINTGDDVPQELTAGRWSWVEKNQTDGVVDNSYYVKYKHTPFNTPTDTPVEGYVITDMLFESLGISGTVVNQYGYTKVTIRNNYNLENSLINLFSSTVRIAKDGDLDVELTFTVSGVTLEPSVGDFYFSTYSDMEITEVTVTGLPGFKTGTIKAIKKYGGANPAAGAGIIARYSGSGDATISYSVWEQTGGPLEIHNITHVNPPEDNTTTFNNIDGSDAITDLTFGAYNGITDISELSSARYSVVFHCDAHNFHDGNAYNWLYAYGFKIDFKTSPIQYDFYVRGEARDDGGNLIEAPADVIEDFINTEVPSVSSSDLDATYMAAFDTDRSAWKLACSINSDMDLG